MPDAVPTVYTEPGPPTDDEDCLVAVRLPADVADELALATVWLSLQLGHRLPITVLRRALLMGGLGRPERVLAALQGPAHEMTGDPTAAEERSGPQRPSSQ